MPHHAFVIEADREQGIKAARAYAKDTLGMKLERNPDFVLLEYGLLSIDDARRIAEIASQKPLMGEQKAIVIAADRAYHEAQNALLKVFEEPAPGAYLFLILPSLGGLLPTLRSRVQVLKITDIVSPYIPEIAGAFLNASKEKRSAVAKKLATGKDEDERRANRDEALAIVNGVEAAAYARFQEKPSGALGALLRDLALLRGHLHERSAPVRMILEHLALITPKNLVS